MSSMRDAASFLTRIPLHRDSTHAPDMSGAVPWFPIVGIILGAIQGAIFVGVFEIATPGIAAVLSITVLALVTGAFHHDGLADMADAFGGGWTREQRLEIMKDSRLGTYGTTALVLVIALEIAALISLAGWVVVAATVVAHGLSRAVAIMTMAVAKPAAASGLGVDYLRGLPRAAVAASSVFTMIGAVVLLGVGALAAIGGACIAAALVVRLANSKIGGITGDVLGAVQQLAKVASLVAIVIVAETTTDLGLLGGLVLDS